MCGILGFAGVRPFIGGNDWLAVGRSSLSHRGPDGTGDWILADKTVGLGHTRLSILDTSTDGAQPMQSCDGSVVVVFNGEIYNHAELRAELELDGYNFESESDTEVLLYSYLAKGKDFVRDLNGMFAFAIYDTKACRLILGRDRAGEKPLYYFLKDGFLIFSSELKALFENGDVPRELDKDGLKSYLYMGFVPAPGALISGINKLQAASLLTFDLESNSISEEKYWELPVLSVKEPYETGRFSACVDEFSELFNDAVTKQLRADVPVGVLLSGGLDSSLVAAVASKIHKGLKTFSVRFPGYGTLDETPHARLIAEHFDSKHFELTAEVVDPTLLIKLAAQFDEPIIDSSMIPTFLVSQEVSKYCTVALGGDGADELFGGYSHYSRLLKVQRFLSFFPSVFVKRFVGTFAKFLPAVSKFDNWVESLEYDYRTQAPMVATYFNDYQQNQLYPFVNFINAISSRDLYNKHMKNGVDLIDRATRTDFNLYLSEDILVKVDRASMLSSLEVRAPFLDRRIIEFAYSKIPSVWKTSGDKKKIFLKEYAKRILPENFDFNRKQGFSVPIDSWLRTDELQAFTNDTLLSSSSSFERRYMSRLLDAHRSGAQIGERIFGLIMLQLWMNTYQCKL